MLLPVVAAGVAGIDPIGGIGRRTLGGKDGDGDGDVEEVRL